MRVSELQERKEIDDLLSLASEQRMTNTTKLLELASEAKRRSEAIGYELGVAHSLSISSWGDVMQGNYDKAIHDATLALKELEKISLRLHKRSASLAVVQKCKADALHNIGTAHWGRGSFQEGIPFFEEAIKLHQRDKRFSAQAASINNLALLYFNLRDYKKSLELHQEALALRRTAPSDTLMSEPPRSILIKVSEAGMSGAFEEKLVKRLESLAPDWSFKVSTLEKLREKQLKDTISLLIAFGIIGGFLIVMVALGLVGVVWQNVTRRTRELGLRRAIGSTAAVIYAQILGELLATTTLATLFGAVVFLQIPLLKLTEAIDKSWKIEFDTYLYGLGLALGFIYLIAGLCALYPSNMATRIAPVQALRYE